MQRILLIGAGKSATSLIDYLLHQCALENWTLLVADASLETAQRKVGSASNGKALQIQVEDALSRQYYIAQSDIVISMLPPHLHILVAVDCLALSKNLLTASYVDESIRSLSKEIEAKGLLFLYEMGLDPGIDHMSAMHLIHRIHNQGGTIHSFISHCGGLVAPESDDNPWHYKISWNPRNIIQAGRAGADYLWNGDKIHVGYEQLFNENNTIAVPELGTLCWYANRDSIAYKMRYGLDNCHTFLRTTLRYPSFCFGWNKLIALQLLSDEIRYDTDGLSIATFFEKHFVQHHLKDTLDVFIAENEGLFNQLLEYLGRHDDNTYLNMGSNRTTLDIMQQIIEWKLALHPYDRDMIVMLHEFGYEIAQKKYITRAHLIVKGNDEQYTAMANTVGLPLGIAAYLILKNKISLIGLKIPTDPAIYEPVLLELEASGIQFKAQTNEVA